MAQRRCPVAREVDVPADGEDVEPKDRRSDRDDEEEEEAMS